MNEYNKFDMSSIPLNSVIVIIGSNSTRKTGLSKCILDNFIIKHSTELKVKNIFLVSERATFDSEYKSHILEENFFNEADISKTILPTQNQRSKESLLRNSIYHNNNSNKILICDPSSKGGDKNTLSSLEKDLCLEHKTSNITLIRTMECSFKQENVSGSPTNLKNNFKVGQMNSVSNSLTRLAFDKRLIPSILDYNLDILFMFNGVSFGSKLHCKNERYSKFIYERYLNTFLGLFPTYKKFEEIFYSLKQDECFVYVSGKLYFYKLPEKYTQLNTLNKKKL